MKFDQEVVRSQEPEVRMTSTSGGDLRGIKPPLNFQFGGQQ
ncbi:hypothetical protein [Brasilonema sp. UFV-L1]